MTNFVGIKFSAFQAHLQIPRYGCAAGIVDGKLFLHGGFSSVYQGDSYTFDFCGDK